MRVLYDFSPTEKYSFEDGLQALEVKEGDVVDVLKKDQDWTLVKINNKRGFVPTDYIEQESESKSVPLKTLNLPVKSAKIQVQEDKEKEKSNPRPSSAAISTMLRKIEIPKVAFLKSDVEVRGTLKKFKSLENLEPDQKTSYLQECKSPTTSKTVYAVVVQYFKGNHGVWTFLIETDSPDHVPKLVYRAYQDFYDLQMTLLASFPAESGISSGTRIIPSIPGPVPFADENVTQRRAADFAVYCKEIFDQMPEHIKNCKILQDFFSYWDCDIAYNKKYGVKEGMPASQVVAPWNQMKVGLGINISDPMKGRKTSATTKTDSSETTVKPIEKPKDGEKSKDGEKPKERKKEDPNELKAPTTFTPHTQKVVARERKASVGKVFQNEEEVDEPVASPLKFEHNGKAFVMLLNNATFKEALIKINAKINTKSVKLSYLDGKDVIEISDDDDWQTVLSLTPRPKVFLK